MKLQIELPSMPERAPRVYCPSEYKVVCLRECPTERDNQLIDTPERAADYWTQHVTSAPNFQPEAECFVVLMVNTRRRIKGHSLIATGTLDTCHVHPAATFRPAVVMSAAAIICMHNHPSGDPTPSEADIRVTRQLIQAGQILKIEVLDHVIIGAATQANPRAWYSLRELGYFAGA